MDNIFTSNSSKLPQFRKPSNRSLKLSPLLNKQFRIIKFNARNSDHATQILQRVNKLIPLFNHPNLTSIKECYIQPNNPLYKANKDQNFKQVFIKIQINSGKLLQQIINELPINEIKKIYIQIQQVVKYLHQKNFVMIDLKPSNILVDHSFNMRLEISCFLKYILRQFKQFKYYQAGETYYQIHQEKSEQLTTFILKLSLLQLMMRKKMICQKCGCSSQLLKYVKHQVCIQKRIFCIKCEQQSHFMHKVETIKQLSFAQMIIILQQNPSNLKIETNNQDDKWILDIFEFIKRIKLTNKYSFKYIDFNKNTIVYSSNNSVYCFQEQQFSLNPQCIKMEQKNNPLDKVDVQISKDNQTQVKKQKEGQQNKTNKNHEKDSKISQQLEVECFILKDLNLIHKDLFSQNIYLWIDQNFHETENQKCLQLLKEQGIDPIIYRSFQEAKKCITNNKNNSRFRIITTASMGQIICSQYKSNQQVVHIYLHGGSKQIGQALKKKQRKIKFYTVNRQDFIKNIMIQSKYDNKFVDLPNFLKITNKQNDQDNAIINKSRYNLHGLMLFKNIHQAKEDFLRFAKYFYSIEDKAFQYEIGQFQKEYPIELDHKLALNWYTKPTFFYGLMNNMLRRTSNPLETVYLRHPFESTFKAIKNLYDEKKQKRTFNVYRGGYINNQQLEYMENNVGQYIEMYGFVSTSEDYEVAEDFIQ